MDVDAPALVYPAISGYRIGEMIGGGGFSKFVSTLTSRQLPHHHASGLADATESSAQSTTPGAASRRARSSHWP